MAYRFGRQSARSHFYGRDQTFNAGRSTRIQIFSGAREKLLDAINNEALRPMAEDIARRANADSGWTVPARRGRGYWGGYWVWYGGTRTRVYGLNAGKDSDRGRRLQALMGWSKRAKGAR